MKHTTKIQKMTPGRSSQVDVGGDDGAKNTGSRLEGLVGIGKQVGGRGSSGGKYCGAGEGPGEKKINAEGKLGKGGGVQHRARRVASQDQSPGGGWEVF